MPLAAMQGEARDYRRGLAVEPTHFDWSIVDVFPIWVASDAACDKGACFCRDLSITTTSSPYFHNLRVEIDAVSEPA